MLDFDLTSPYVTEDNVLNHLFANYLKECQYTKRLSLQTIKSYQEVFTTFRKIIPEARTTKDLHPHLMNEFFQRLGTRKRQVGKDIKIGIKPSTTSTYFNKLMAFFRWLEINEYIPHGHISEKIPRPQTPIYDDDRALKDQDVSQILTAITLYRGEDSFIYKRDLALVNTLLFTGIRKGELLGLRVSDIHFEASQILVNHITSKSIADRLIPMHPALKGCLKEFFKERKKRQSVCPYLFTSSRTDTALTEHGLKHWVNKYKKLSGVNFHLHRFRHTFACTLAKTGVDVVSIMRLLGHTSIRMTERYLRSIKTEDARSYIERMSF